MLIAILKSQAREINELKSEIRKLKADAATATENEMAGLLENMRIDTDTATESELLGRLGSMRIGERENQKLVALQAQFDQVLGERNRFAALADQLTARRRGLESDLERAAQQVDEQQQRVTELENTVGEMDRAGVALEHQVKQHQATIDAMKKDREDLVKKGNACLSTISLLEISLRWRDIELTERKQNERKMEKKMQIIKDRVRKIRELLEPGLRKKVNKREFVEEGTSAAKEQLQLQPQGQQQAKQKQQQLQPLLLQPYYHHHQYQPESSQKPTVQRTSKRRRDQRDDGNEDEAERDRIWKR